MDNDPFLLKKLIKIVGKTNQKNVKRDKKRDIACCFVLCKSKYG